MNELKMIAPELWILDSQVRLMAGVWFPARMVIVRLPGGKLWVHSPVALTDTQAQSVEALGQVAYLIAPNSFHYKFLLAAHQRFPEAQVHVSQALIERKGTAHNAILGQGEPEAWQGFIRGIEVEGIPTLGESVFFHQPSNTLIVTDLVFNMRATRGWLTSWVLRAAGTHQRLAQSKLIGKMIQDPSKLQASVEQILSLDFERVIMAHGEILETDARNQLAVALGQMSISDLGATSRPAETDLRHERFG